MKGSKVMPHISIYFVSSNYKHIYTHKINYFYLNGKPYNYIHMFVWVHLWLYEKVNLYKHNLVMWVYLQTFTISLCVHVCVYFHTHM